ncbi:MAG TPA: hypothetical protein VF881_13205 [Polyangiaceae bacterium]
MVEDPPSVDAIAVALRVARAIEASGGAYFVGGSLASSMQGEPRATNDIDIVLDLPIGRVREFARALGPDFEVDTDMLRDALAHGGSCNVFYLPTVMKVDFYRLQFELREPQQRGLSGTQRADDCDCWRPSCSHPFVRPNWAAAPAEVAVSFRSVGHRCISRPACWTRLSSSWQGSNVAVRFGLAKQRGAW